MRHCWGTTPVFQTEEPTSVESAQWPGGPGCGANTRHRESPQTNFARNLTRSFFEISHKRCNSNDANSMFEQAAGELRATLLGNHSGISNGRTHQRGARPTVRRARPGLPQTAATLNPDIFRMQFPPSNNQRELKNRRISTIPFQNLKYTQGNCMRRCWGTTPISGEVGLTARPHPLRRAAPVTWHYTRYVALHPLRSAAPVT